MENPLTLNLSDLFNQCTFSLTNYGFINAICWSFVIFGFCIRCIYLFRRLLMNFLVSVEGYCGFKADTNSSCAVSKGEG